MTTWRIIKWTAVPITAIAVGAGALVASAAPAAPAAGVPAAAVSLVEDAACGITATAATAPAAPAATPADAAGAAGATAAVAIKVTIPPVAWLEVDENGRLLAAATNTGCAPRTGDTVVARRPDRSVVADVAIDLDTVAWVGDFTQPAVLVPQTDPVVIGR
jgi:pilus assembly protein FimV